jgi:hypothetical protein
VVVAVLAVGVLAAVVPEGSAYGPPIVLAFLVLLLAGLGIAAKAGRNAIASGYVAQDGTMLRLRRPHPRFAEQVAGMQRAAQHHYRGTGIRRPRIGSSFTFTPDPRLESRCSSIRRVRTAPSPLRWPGRMLPMADPERFRDSVNCCTSLLYETERAGLRGADTGSELGGRYWDRTSDLLGVNAGRVVAGCLGAPCVAPDLAHSPTVPQRQPAVPSGPADFSLTLAGARSRSFPIFIRWRPLRATSGLAGSDQGTRTRTN